MKKTIEVNERVLEWHSPQYPIVVEKPPPQYEDAEIIADTQPPTKAVAVTDKPQNVPTLVTTDNLYRQPNIVTDKMRNVSQWLIGATVIVALLGGFVYVVSIVLELVAATLVVAIEVVKGIGIIVCALFGMFVAFQVIRYLFASGSHSAPPTKHQGTQQRNDTGQQVININININGSGSQSFNKY